MEGWIKLHRKLMRHWIWHNEKYLKAWIYCLFRANHSDNKVLIGSNLSIISPGEFVTSINHFAKDTGLSMQEVRTFWNLLVKDNMINKESTNNSTMITICHYIDYQNIQQTRNKRTTNEQQTNNKRTTTDKNVKNYNNEKNIPTWDEFKDYALSKKKNIDHESLRLKYEAWVENNWKDGYDKSIKNWKSKLLQTIPHLKESEVIRKSRVEIEKAPDDFGMVSPTALTREQYLKQKKLTNK